MLSAGRQTPLKAATANRPLHPPPARAALAGSDHLWKGACVARHRYSWTQPELETQTQYSRLRLTEIISSSGRAQGTMGTPLAGDSSLMLALDLFRISLMVAPFLPMIRPIWCLYSSMRSWHLWGSLMVLSSGFSSPRMRSAVRRTASWMPGSSLPGLQGHGRKQGHSWSAHHGRAIRNQRQHQVCGQKVRLSCRAGRLPSKHRAWD